QRAAAGGRSGRRNARGDGGARAPPGGADAGVLRWRRLPGHRPRLRAGAWEEGARMKSPFPGMDPYLEAPGLWEGFHNHLIHNIDEAVAQVLPRGYTIDVGVRRYVVVLEAEGKTEHRTKAPVTVTERVSGKKPRKKGVVDEYPSVPMRAFVAEEFKE